jgi:hypothetical protein
MRNVLEVADAEMSITETAVQILSAVTALGAAFCWWQASVAYVPAAYREDGYVGPTFDGGISFLAGKKRAKLFDTLQLQSNGTRRAQSRRP